MGSTDSLFSGDKSIHSPVVISYGSFGLKSVIVTFNYTIPDCISSPFSLFCLLSIFDTVVYITLKAKFDYLDAKVSNLTSLDCLFGAPHIMHAKSASIELLWGIFIIIKHTYIPHIA